MPKRQSQKIGLNWIGVELRHGSFYKLRDYADMQTGLRTTNLGDSYHLSLSNFRLRSLQGPSAQTL